MDRDAFLTGVGKRIRERNAPQEKNRIDALARSSRIKEIEGVIQPYAAALTANSVENTLTIQGDPSDSLTWRLPFADKTSLAMSVRYNSREDKLGLSVSHIADDGVYIDLPFLHKKTPTDDINPELSQVHLDDRWSPSAFEEFLQDTITAYLDETSEHGSP